MVAPGGSDASSEQSVQDAAKQQELHRLQQQIGRLVAGPTDLFVGEVAAVERRDTTRRLLRGRVVASLERHEDRLTLTIVSPRWGVWLRLSQTSEEPLITHSTLLRPIRASAGITGSCSGCLVDLSSGKLGVLLDRFAAEGRLHDVAGTPFRVELSGYLEPAPPSYLDLEDLAALNPGPDAQDGDPSFTRRQTEGVRRVEREMRERVPPPADSPPQTRCERVTRYSAEHFFELTDSSRFGVREVEILGSQICCFDHDSHGGGEQCSPEEIPR